MTNLNHQYAIRLVFIGLVLDAESRPDRGLISAKAPTSGVTCFTFGETQSGEIDGAPAIAETGFRWLSQNIDRGTYQVYRRRRSAIMTVRNNAALNSEARRWRWVEQSFH